MKKSITIIFTFLVITATHGQTIPIDTETPQENANGVFAYSTYSHWNKTNLSYFIENTTPDIPMAIQEDIFEEAFDIWANSTNLEFTQVSNINSADITIAFRDDPSIFNTNALAHARTSYYQGGTIISSDIEYNDETYQYNNDCNGGYDLLTIAIHEIGHSLGLGHSDVVGSIMYPSLSVSECKWSLHQDDIDGIQSLYEFSGNWNPFKTLIADVDGDGMDDVVWNETTSDRNRVYVGLSNGDCTFTFLVSQTFLSGGWSPYKTLIGDVNGDGNDDIIWNETSEIRNRVYVGVSNGDGTFTITSSQDFLSGGWSPYKTLIGDVNGDGNADIVWNETSAARNRIYVGISNGDNTFNISNSQTYPNGGWSTYATFLGDIDGDNMDDLVWNTITNQNRVYSAISNGDGSYILNSFQDRPEVGWSPYRIMFGDFNGDEQNELLWNELRTQNRVYTSTSNGNGEFTFNSFQDHFNQGWNPYKSLIGDFNGDNKSDVLWNETRVRNRVYVGLGNDDSIDFCDFQDHIYDGGGMDITSSIGEVENNNLKIYPNPTKDIIFIDTQLNSDFQIRIYDVNGIMKYFDTNPKQVNITNFANGIYMMKVRFTGNSQEITKRIVVIK